VIRVQGGVLFDIDGTLLVGSISHLLLLGATLSRHLGREVPVRIEGERPMLDHTDVSGWIDVQVVRTVLQAQTPGPPDEARVAELMSLYEREYGPAAAKRPSSMSVVPGAAECLERLHAAGIPLGLVTGNASFVARAKLAAVGLDRFFSFDPDLGFGDWRADRPAAACAAVIALIGDAGDAASLIYAEDTPHDMQAARAAGVRPVGVLTGARTADQLTQAGAAIVIRSVAELFPVDDGLGAGRS
jgi:phosphoglycolate phosphatase-like HAD superfamily hydrolase